MDEEGHALLKMKRGWIAAVTLCFVIWMGTLLGGFGEKQAAKGADRYDHVFNFQRKGTLKQAVIFKPFEKGIQMCVPLTEMEQMPAGKNH